jgi:pyruvate/2-oxoglutarate dehydrogenase complex dihydrolipoamide acyltransferase (E2) component
MRDRHQKLDFADLWIRDGLRVCSPPGGFGTVDVDMTCSLAIAAEFAQSEIRINSNHIIYRAVALALARHPEIHKMGAGSRVMYPGAVDLGISIAGESFVAPVMVLRGAQAKGLVEIARESFSLMRKAKRDDRKMRSLLRRWGWLVPFGWMRRVILSWAFNRLWFRRGGVGTFQISSISSVDSICPFMFNTAGILGIGGVRNRVVPVDGAIMIRPMITLTCCINHEVWDGQGAATFLTELRRILESGELAAEIPNVSIARMV